MPRPATATRERILAAAYARFAHYGYRRTSMEDIAAAADLSRAALYLQFQNKEEIFRSLSRQLHDEALAGASTALAAAAPLAERLQAAAEAKHARFVEIAATSPHGSELLDASNRVCGEHPLEAQQRFRALLTAAFRRAAQQGEIDLAAVGLSAAEAADLFADAVSGLKGMGISIERYRERLAALVRVFVAGLGGRRAAMPRRHGRGRRVRTSAEIRPD